jgi:multiple sugar transport system ATP-binding protein
MRTSLQQLHGRLGVTTVYVTHDQVEAMTLGQRVAVMRDGRIQQVDAPQSLYEHPANLFVAAFIGSPAMNLVQANVSDAVSFGRFSVPLNGAHRGVGGDVVFGVRPEAFEDAAFAPPELPQIDVKVEVLEELGSDAYVFFEVDAQQVVVEDALSDVAEDTVGLLAGLQDRALFAARVDSRTRARVGDTMRLAIDPSRFYFFSRDTGASLLDGSA